MKKASSLLWSDLIGESEPHVPRIRKPQFRGLSKSNYYEPKRKRKRKSYKDYDYDILEPQSIQYHFNIRTPSYDCNIVEKEYNNRFSTVIPGFERKRGEEKNANSKKLEEMMERRSKLFGKKETKVKRYYKSEMGPVVIPIVDEDEFFFIRWGYSFYDFCENLVMSIWSWFMTVFGFKEKKKSKYEDDYVVVDYDGREGKIRENLNKSVLMMEKDRDILKSRVRMMPNTFLQEELKRYRKFRDTKTYGVIRDELKKRKLYDS